LPEVDIDGANGIQKLWHITLTGIKPTVGIMFLLSVGGLFGSNMEQILLLQTPGTFDVSEVIDTYVLKRGINMNQFDYATAVGLFRSVISLALVVSTNYISKKLTDISLW
jgi:putative aldouronate transport system permease protein